MWPPQVQITARELASAGRFSPFEPVGIFFPIRGFFALKTLESDRPHYKKNNSGGIASGRSRLYILKKSLSYALHRNQEDDMAIRKSAIKSAPPRPNLEHLLEQARVSGVTDEQLQEQRISFAYGNAPENSGITKESARLASRSLRLARA